MNSWLARSFASLRRALSLGDSPRHLASGLALGLVLGLVPKGNLLCVMLCLTILCTRANLGMTTISAVVFSLLSPWVDPLTHRVGLNLLTWDLLIPLWDLLYSLPGARWTAFNNTVVLGSLAVGGAASLPMYWTSRMVLEGSARRADAVTSQRATDQMVRVDGSQPLSPTLEAWLAKDGETEPAERAESSAPSAEHVDQEGIRRLEPGHEAEDGPRPAILPSLHHVPSPFDLPADTAPPGN